MEAFAHNTPQKQNLLNLTSVKKFISLLKSIHVLLLFFFLQAWASYKSLFTLPSPFCAGIWLSPCHL